MFFGCNIVFVAVPALVSGVAAHAQETVSIATSVVPTKPSGFYPSYVIKKASRL